MAEDFKKYVPTGRYEKKVKIDRFLSREGVCSRSEALRFAKEGLIKVNGSPVLDADKRFDPYEDQLSIHSSIIEVEESQKILCAINKPTGILSQAMPGKIRSANTLLNADSYANYVFGKSAQSDFVANHKMEFFPIGKLEKEFNGLLLMTNHKPWISNVSTHKVLLEREYHIKVDGKITRKETDKIYKGYYHDDYLIKPKKIVIHDDQYVSLCLSTDYKNQIYKLLSKIGRKPLEVQCVRIDKFELGSLKGGQWVVFDPLSSFKGGKFK